VTGTEVSKGDTVETRLRILFSIAVAGTALGCIASPTASTIPPQEVPTAAPPSPQAEGAASGDGAVIPELASIQVLGVPYFDDAGTSQEGIAVAILFFDANMMGIDQT
jgi:hypothetical protein